MKGAGKVSVPGNLVCLQKERLRQGRKGIEKKQKLATELMTGAGYAKTIFMNVKVFKSLSQSRK
jgi:hypothetical protein